MAVRVSVVLKVRVRVVMPRAEDKPHLLEVSDTKGFHAKAAVKWGAARETRPWSSAERGERRVPRGTVVSRQCEWCECWSGWRWMLIGSGCIRGS